MTLGDRFAPLLLGLALVSCSSSPLCPDPWEDAPEIRSTDHCAPPRGVTEAAEAQLTTGLYGYVTVGQSSGCGECEQVLQHDWPFLLFRLGPDGAVVEEMSIEVDADATYAVELTPGDYRPYYAPLTLEGLESDEFFVRLGEGDVVFLGLVGGCAVGC